MIRYSTSIVTHLVFLLCLISITVARQSNDDISIVHQRVLEQMIWPAKKDIPTIEKNALSYVKSLNKSCYWPDIKYADKSLASWSTSGHMLRITTMLQAFTVPGSSLQHNVKIVAAAHCALKVWLAKDWQNPNWWFNQIQVPLQATSQLLMLGKNATRDEMDKIRKISYRADWWRRKTLTGTNLIWMIQVQLYRSLATKNKTGVQQGFTRMWKDMIVLPLGGEGIQNDWSYQMHGQQLMSASYGQSWAVIILKFVECSKNTPYAPNQKQLLVLANYLTDGEVWMTFGKQWDWSPTGRTITRPEKRVNSLDIQSNSVRSLAQLIQSNKIKTTLLNWADRIDGRPDAPLLTGNKHFYTSDYQVHRRASWICTIKMQSVRTNPVECINGENQKGEHTGQGVLNLYINSIDNYFNIFPLFDWQAINGITVEHGIPLESCLNGRFQLQKLSFVGGASDGKYGLAMMDTSTHHLTAKRSWHFYDDAIVALANDLKLQTSTTAWTTLASRLLPNGIITVGFFNSSIISLSDGKYLFPYIKNRKSNVQWIHVGGTDIGYLLQHQGQYSALGVEIGTKKGNYDTIGPYNFKVSERMLTIWIDHGSGPFTLDYCYFIVPNINVKSMPALIKRYDDEQIFSCISTKKSFHGIMWPKLKRASFVLWNNAETKFSCQGPSFKLTIQLSDAGTYLFSETSNDFSVTASHPTRVNGKVMVTVDRVGYGQGCVMSSNASPTKVTLTLPSSSQHLGASVTVVCKKNKIASRDLSKTTKTQ